MAKSTRSSTRGKSRTEKVKIDDARVEVIAPGKLSTAEWVGMATTATIGLGGGWIASLVLGGSGLLRYVITGVLGAFLGRFILDRMGWHITVGHPLVDRVMVAALGAMLVILLARLIA